jgi:putative Mg2+ transporter-C (MgtC) family protein
VCGQWCDDYRWLNCQIEGDEKMINTIDTNFIVALCVATVLGGVLGLEREIHGRPAGLRTHLLVSLGSATFMILSPYVASMGKGVPADPGRIAAQIVTGIGFLGAGAIVREGISVHGLTTAACLWIAAAIGMAAGVGRYMGAVLITVIALFALLLLPWVEARFKAHSYRVLEVVTPLDVDVYDILNAVKEQDVLILRYDLDHDYIENTLKITFVVRMYQRDDTDHYAYKIVKKLESLDLSPRRIVWHPR